MLAGGSVCERCLIFAARLNKGLDLQIKEPFPWDKERQKLEAREKERAEEAARKAYMEMTDIDVNQNPFASQRRSTRTAQRAAVQKRKPTPEPENFEPVRPISFED